MQILPEEQSYVDLIKHFVYLKEEEIFEKFKKEFPDKHIHFQSEDNNDLQGLLIQGTRKDSVLMVAHVDTVMNDSKRVSVAFSEGMFYSGNRQRGLDEEGKPYMRGFPFGADDRAGVAAIWDCRKLGHSILLTTGEEQGCAGATWLMSRNDRAELINNHQFALELDRKGRNDIVFYDVGTKDFAKYCVYETGYEIDSGTFTDICVLCEKMCGVNISIGYRNEHSCNEFLNLRWWLRTVETVKKWLGQDNIPQFSRL